MNIIEIVKDSLRYPFSDWKKILVLGIFGVIATLSINELIGAVDLALYDTSDLFMAFLSIIGLLSIFIERGYQFRILNSSLSSMAELPKFNSWAGMLKDGVKLSIVTVIYLIPFILIYLVLKSPFVAILQLTFKSLPSLLSSTIIPLKITFFTAIGPLHLIGFSILILFMNLLFIMFLLSIANMAKNNGKLTAAFQFHQITNKLSTLGWKNFVVWYLMTESIYLIILSISGIVINEISHLISPNVGTALGWLIATVLISLIVISYLSMYLYRSLALLFL